MWDNSLRTVVRLFETLIRDFETLDRATVNMLLGDFDTFVVVCYADDKRAVLSTSPCLLHVDSATGHEASQRRS